MFKRTTSCARVGIGVATLALAAHSVPCRAHNSTERVSIATSGVQGNGFSGYGPAISADGRFVAFISDASNLVPGDSNRVDDVFVRDRQLGTTRRVNVGPDGIQANNFSFLYPPAISADGRLSRSHRLPPTWCRLTPTERGTCSFVTGKRPQPGA